MTVDDDLPAQLGRLRNEISAELYAQLMIRDEIGQEDVGGVAYAIAQRLRRTFRIEWEPWEDEGETDTISEMISADAATWRVSRA